MVQEGLSGHCLYFPGPEKSLERAVDAAERACSRQLHRQRQAVPSLPRRRLQRCPPMA